MAAVDVEYKELEACQGNDMLLMMASGYLEPLLSKPAVEGLLEPRYRTFAEILPAIVQAASLDQPPGVA